MALHAKLFAEQALRYVGVGSPLLLLVFVPSLRPDAWSAPGPWRWADPVKPFTLFLLLSYRFDSPVLGGRMEQAVAALILIFLVVPAYLSVAAASAAAGGAWACWAGIALFNAAFLARPLGFGAPVLRRVALWTNIIAAQWISSGLLDAALAAHGRGVDIGEVLRAMWWSPAAAAPPHVDPTAWADWKAMAEKASTIPMDVAFSALAVALYTLALAV
eukprot:CAMPEP_0198520294 /NCGR_PEP_ID=MMETSP1462-20131121/20240_1 /TAXON_ID=1333877 /ORGANISM="Brandtodinium nutriculum, Strain RCC3387" /LENGTH=216 /DNA_ID=CAMNT_0044249917 /DNA_START=68 /DNA_END=714 /DNA_ORIENTATION=-